jgi:hypothetical protein
MLGICINYYSLNKFIYKLLETGEVCFLENILKPFHGFVLRYGL